MTTAEILEKAAEYIEENGWLQNDWRKENKTGGASCAAWAIASARGLTASEWPCPVIDVVKDHLGCEVDVWNDEPGRTQQDVTRMLRSLAAKLEDQRSGAQEPLYGPPSINLDSDVISALVEHTEAPVALPVDRDYGDENWHVRNYEPVES